METITAEEIRAKYMPYGAINLKGKGLGDGKKQYEYEKKKMNEMLVEFASIRVAEALEQAAKNAKIINLNEARFAKPALAIDKESILNAYPLNLIK